MHLETGGDSCTVIRSGRSWGCFFNSVFLKLLLCIQTQWIRKFFLRIQIHKKSHKVTLCAVFSFWPPRPHLYSPALSRLCFLAFWNCFCTGKKHVLSPASRLAGWILFLRFLLPNSTVFLSTCSPCCSAEWNCLAAPWNSVRRTEEGRIRCWIKSCRHGWFCLLPAILKA